MPDTTDIRPHQTADFDQNLAKVNTDLDRFLTVFRDVRASGPGPRELDIAGLAGHLTEIGTVPGLADLLAAAIVRLAEPAPAAEPTEAQRCWSCDHHPADDHDDDGCTRIIRCSLVTVEQADEPTFCPCASSTESARIPEQDAQAGDDQ